MCCIEVQLKKQVILRVFKEGKTEVNPYLGHANSKH